jgi:hypothetical protein
MFRQLADLIAQPTGQQRAQQVLDLHPIQLSRFLEEAWLRRSVPPTSSGVPLPTGEEMPAAISSFQNELDSGIAPVVDPAKPYPPRFIDHLIYAYLIENTRVYEIFKRVLEEYAFGERLKVVDEPAQRWLRTTEQLFYSNGLPYQIYSFNSWIRPDARAARRNAYFRMFGMDLNHGTDDNAPYPYPRAAEANTDFVRVFEELLREVWRAIENITNSSGPNPTDVSTIADIATALYNMVTVRRLNGNLAREELWAVSTMNWFHLTLSYDTPIVVSLKADASSPEERLMKIGERVGLPAHSRSHNYFELAARASLVLRELETGAFNSVTGAPFLFLQPNVLPGAIGDVMQEIVAHWSMATGRDFKTRQVSLGPPQPTPVPPLPRPIVAPLASRNGHGDVSRQTVPT